MPIPTRKGGESEDEYIPRCMAAIGGEYPQDQALAICYDKFRENMNKTTQQTVNQKIARMSKLRGINLNPDGSYDMKEPCWDGYEQYGTKIVDGREVPNCIPID
jgi:hypothetical protein